MIIMAWIIDHAMNGLGGWLFAMIGGAAGCRDLGSLSSLVTNPS
ncbi:hypothetical protein CSB93_0853 [Pseudomonas paraeruginosa]|uniref:Uncharacterized protein n=1 Tax=Pseudomonas paraeruginosa TaxID=2994495 RepID=A0A2R3IND2_9PSED|nr:hypothetical protein CSB93_0853 [Pseudomonas paraeruginosa]AWE93766.1 hypothetical protein CSC28_6169 [Pseudomonas paraeruginosa]